MSLLFYACCITTGCSFFSFVLDTLLLLYRDPGVVSHLQDLIDEHDRRDDTNGKSWRRMLDLGWLVILFVTGFAAFVIVLAWIRHESYLEQIIARIEEELSK